MQRKPDIELAIKMLDLELGKKLGEGLRKTIDYFKDVL